MPTIFARAKSGPFVLLMYPAKNDASYTVNQLKTATGATVVEGFAPTQTYRLVTLPNSNVMKKGRAYWVYVPADATWTFNW